MTDDLTDELKAMVQLEATLKSLGEEERGRVLKWVNARFSSSGKGGSGAGVGNPEDARDAVEQFSDLATFYSAVAPATDSEKALVVAYWLQYREGVADVEAQTVNTRLKHLGHGVGNITRALETLKDERPVLVIQTKKEGSSQQARKKFRVTVEGRKKIEGMIPGNE